MPSLALAKALKDFGAKPGAIADPFEFGQDFALPVDDIPSMFEEPVFAVPQPDTETLIAEAVAHAEAALTERLAAEHAEALRVERERHAEEIATLQTRFSEEASAKIATRLGELEDRLVDLTGAVAARILGGVLTDDLSARSIERLASVIRAALVDDDALRIRVHGNPALFEALRARLDTHAEQFDFNESAIFDLSITINDNVYETRLAEWSVALAESLE